MTAPHRVAWAPTRLCPVVRNTKAHSGVPNVQAAHKSAARCRWQAAGNYAPALLPNRLAAGQGCPITLYLDAQTRQYARASRRWLGSSAPRRLR